MTAALSWTVGSLLQGFAVVSAHADVRISGLSMDSREVQQGDLFFACRGIQHHGLSHALQAVEHGAAAIAWEPDDEHTHVSVAVPEVAVPQLGQYAGKLADRFYASPSHQLAVIGVTGTNGKTSVSHFIAEALKRREGNCGLLGTLGYGLLGELERGQHTTPDVVKVHRWLRLFADLECRHAVMEVSSHALDQGRVEAVRFDTAVLTNLSHDHLDYHGDMACYAAAKEKLFGWPGLRYAVINADDAYGLAWLSGLSSSVRPIAYTLKSAAVPGVESLYVQHLHQSPQGLDIEVVTPWGDAHIRSELIGRFNVSNLLAALAVLLLHDVDLQSCADLLSAVKPVAGRMERFGIASEPLVIVDYAHTPDALEQVLLSLREHVSGRLFCVFGCGGDRDQAKRPLMGEIAERLADKVIITDDNPRREKARDITAQILSGTQNPADMTVIHDRRQAISAAIREAGKGDCVLVAGKGHEQTQIVGVRQLPFDDRAVVQSILAERAA
jgi:UDP-N-acetylmuramoyl-L-alanyl-D-glutamate--2,6-diaminopimelate ligase